MLNVARSSSSTEVCRFFESNRPALARLCRRWSGGDPVEAEELLAAAALRAVEAARSTTASIHNPFGWWATIISNLARDQLRAKARTTILPLEDPEDYASSWPDASAHVILKGEVRELRAQFRRLTTAQARALALRCAGYAYEDISRELSVSVEYARKLVQLARAALRKRYVRRGLRVTRRLQAEHPEPSLRTDFARGAEGAGGDDARIRR